jgi:hypothetical protein
MIHECEECGNDHWSPESDHYGECEHDGLMSFYCDTCGDGHPTLPDAEICCERPGEWPYEEFERRINLVFQKMTDNGIFARADFWCCQSCGCAAVPESGYRGYAFYHEQDKDGAIDEYDYSDSISVYLAFGKIEGEDPVTIGNEICSYLQTAGFRTEWSGDAGTRILVEG